MKVLVMDDLDLIDVGIDDSDFIMEVTDDIEYEISENVSLLYNKSTKKFTIEGIDQETYDEYSIDIDDSFNGMQVDDIYISKEDFDDFKKIVLN